MNSGIEYLNLTDASEAEKEILRSMLFEGVADEPTGNNLFQFLKPMPPGFGSFETEIGSESSEVSELCPVSGHSTNPGSDICQESQNGQVLRIPSQNVHLVDHGEGEILNGNGPNMLISQGPPPQHIRNFYPGGHVMTGPPPHIHGGHAPAHPMGHVPMSVYQPHMTHPQMMQGPGGAYFSHATMQQQQYQPILHYGYPPPPYMQTDNDHSHNHVHLSKHLDPSTHHSSTTSLGPSKYRNKNQRPRRNDDQNLNHNPYPPYFPNVGYGPVYYNPGIAQTVTNMTGPPLIMPSTGAQPQPTLYSPYPSPNQTHVYAGSTGAEVELSSQGSGPVTVIPVELSEITQQVVSPKMTVKHEMKELSKNVNVLEPLKINDIASNQTTPTRPSELLEDVTLSDKEPVSVDVPLATSELTQEGKTVIANDSPTGMQTLVDLVNVEEDLRGHEQTTKAAEQPLPPRKVVANLTRKQLSQDNSETIKATASKSTNGPSSWVNAAGSHHRISPPVPSLTTKGDAPDFPELGQAGAFGPAPPKSTSSSKERSWASIASSKTGNGPSNGVIQAVPDNVAQTITVGNDESYDGYQKNAQNTNSRSFATTASVINDFSQAQDKSNYIDENDPIALQLGEFLSNYVLDHHSLSLTPRGLSNQSNFCYINATLQSLIACPPFVNLFRSMKDIIGKWPCKATPIIQSVFNFVMEFEPITRISQGRHKRPNDAFNVGSTFEAAGIRRVLGLFDGATFKVEGRQEDAEEFLSHLLNGLHDEMIKVIKWMDKKKSRPNSQNSNNPVGRPITPTTNGDSFEMKGEEDDDQWQVMGPKNKGCMTRKTCLSKSPISEMFVGQMCSALNRTIGLKSTTLQPFFTLQLDIQEDNIHSVRDALEGLSTKEEVTGFMSGSGQETGAWKQLSLEVLPIIMILHMKRFVYDKSGNKIHKLDKKVDFPVDLEIGRELLSVNSKGKYTLKQRQYKLFAAVYHDGEEAHKGHYIADCFHPSGGSLWGQFGWIRYDDTTVKSVAEPLILNPQPPRVPYLLYYRRVDTLSQTKKDRL